MDIKHKISDTLGAVFALTFIIIVVIFFINGPIQQNHPHPFLFPLKEAISTTGDYFGGIAALGAACLAAQLFNDWRVQADHQTKKELIIKIQAIDTDIKNYIFDNVEKLNEMNVMYKTQPEGLPPKHIEYLKDLYRLHNYLLRYLMDLKIEVQNFGFVMNETELAERSIATIIKIEEALENFFKPIKENSRSIDSGFYHYTIKNYQEYVSKEVTSDLYESITLPLLAKLSTRSK